MVGAMLSRVFSRTKVAAPPSPVVWNEKIDLADPQTGSPEHLDKSGSMEQKRTTISFDRQVKPGTTTITTEHKSPRKHSYASVKEDLETPQSFVSRRLSHNVQPATNPEKSDAQGIPGLIVQELQDGYSLHDYKTTLDLADEEEEFAIYSDSDCDSTLSQPSTTLETMPEEILDIIFSHVTLDGSKDRYVDPKVDLFNLLFVSRTIHSAALRVLYKHVKVPQSKAFAKFNNALSQDAQLGSLVHCLDFSHFSSIGFGRARSATVEKPYLTPQTLKACLDRLPSLKAFLVHEHVDDELDTTVLTTLLSMPTLQALDLCASSSKMFTESFTSATLSLTEPLANIRRLSLHECTTLPAKVFENLLSRLTRLTHLDVAHTMVNDKALMSIPASARITHLNLERCTQITGSVVVKFLTTHPAARGSMVYLNLMADASRYRLLSEDDLSDLLPALPSSLRSLNLGGSRINSSHACELRRLATHLEELGLKGANLSLSQDVAHILSLVSGDCDEELQHPEWRHNLRYIDLTDMRSVSQMSLTYSPASITAVAALPLEVIETGDKVLQDISKRLKNVKNPDWVVRELGRRGWFVRQASASSDGAKLDDGYRSWKMGARWWGMRKIPMFEQDTGGMYGYFMFKRA